MTRNTLSFVIPIFASLTSLACDPAPMVGSDAGAATDDAHIASDDAGPDAPLPPTRLPVGTADRPVDINLPPAHDGTTRLPLFILLHGYSSNAAQQDAYLGFSRAVRAAGAYSILPNGTVDAGGNRFWNASAFSLTYLHHDDLHGDFAHVHNRNLLGHHRHHTFC